MLSEERKKQICELVNQNNAVKVQELMDLFSASEATIRRDLNELDARGLVKKVHGGAVSILRTVNYDFKVSEREALNQEAKVKIAQYAAALIKPNDLVYLDAGTTISYLIDSITCRDAIYVTNAVMHARRLADLGYTVYLTGGKLKASTEALIGSACLNFIQRYHFTIGFFGTNAVNTQNGFSTPEPEEAMIKECALKHTVSPYVLCDASKFDMISSVTFADYQDAKIITTGDLPASYQTDKNICLL